MSDDDGSARGAGSAGEAADVLAGYRERGLAGRLGFGHSPALLVVDLQRGFTEEGSPLGAAMDAEVEAVARLVDAAHAREVPVFFTVTGYGPGAGDGGLFTVKVPSLKRLRWGERWTELDPRLPVGDGDTVIRKEYASAFFGTALASMLTALGVDTLLVTGCTTSGCVRASAVDALQHGFRPVVPRECVADRAEGPHEANLLDIQGKYGDVLGIEEVLTYLGGLGSESEREEAGGEGG